VGVLVREQHPDTAAVENDGPIGFATPDTQMVSVARCSTLVNADAASNGVAVLRPHLRRVKRVTSFAGRARVRPLRDRQEIIGQVLFHHTCGCKRDGTTLLGQIESGSPRSRRLKARIPLVVLTKPSK
jgi:hypothetical protein